jgi:outer membrane protein assembly factor BamB
MRQPVWSARPGLSRRKALGLAAAGAGLAIARWPGTASAAPVFNDRPDATLKLPSGLVGRSSPAFYDLDGDGRAELVFGTTRYRLIDGRYDKGGQAKLFAIRSSISGGRSSLAIVAEQPTVGPINGSVSVGALETGNDPHVLVPVGGEVSDPIAPDNGLHCYRFNRQARRFELLWNFDTGHDDWPDGVGDGIRDPVYGSAVLAARYQRPTLDVMYGGWDRWIYQLDAAGRKLWDFHAADTVWSTPAIGDLSVNVTKSGATLPGRHHFFIGQDIGPSVAGGVEQVGGGFLNAFRPDGTLLWRNFYDDTVFSAPAVADIDGDGDLEVVFTTGPFYYESGASRRVGQQTPRPVNHLICVDAATGREKWRLPLGGFGGYSSPALADLHGRVSSRGLPTYQIAVAYGTGNTQREDSRLLLVDSDGRELWSRRPVDRDGKTDGLRTSPVIAGGRIFQAVDWGVAEFDAAGNQRTTYHTGLFVQASPVVADLDGDGTLELYVVGGNLFETSGATNATSGWVYQWVLRGLPATTQWPMFHLDASRTGYLPPANRQVAPVLGGAPYYFSARTTLTVPVPFRFRLVLPPGSPNVDPSRWVKVNPLVERVGTATQPIAKIEVDPSGVPSSISPGTDVTVVFEAITYSGASGRGDVIIPNSVSVPTPGPQQRTFVPVASRAARFG